MNDAADARMQRVMARLMTVAQAARIGGTEAVHPHHPGREDTMPSSNSTPEAPDVPVVVLDVRDDLRNGREPFSRIMTAVAALREGEALCLRATFEPVPLFTVMDRRGFDHRAEQLADDDWRVLFYPHGPGQAEAREGAVAGVAAGPPAPAAAASAREVVLDVRGLEPPEPMQRTLEALADLPEGAVLIQVNVRIPHFLLPILKERGFDYEIREPEPGRVVVTISRSAPDAATRTTANACSIRPAAPPMTPRREAMHSSPAKLVELDVRPIPPRDKHPTIFRTFDSLAAGESMMLINDHDPAPLRYQMQAERSGAFEWTYVEQGPTVWRVHIEHK